MTSTTDAAHRAGVSFRQLDYWLRNGLVPGVVATEGTGYPRSLSSDQVRFISMMGALVKKGMQPKAAAALVTELLDKGEIYVGTWIKIAAV